MNASLWLLVLGTIFHAFCGFSSDASEFFLLKEAGRDYAYVSQKKIEYGRQKAREMFYTGWDSYMRYAYPADELDPIHCTGRGADHQHPENININDVLGDYSLTLIDSLDSLVVFGDTAEFKRSVRLVIDNVSFERNTTVQVFEATIRVIGGLLSAHMIASDSEKTFGDFYIDDYEGELLTMAHDLATRLLPAFEGTATGIPYTRVNLQRGVLPGTVNLTCTAGAGSLLLEFGVLSRLLGDETFENLARKVNKKLWSLRNPTTGLFGNLVNIQTGDWVDFHAGLGAGLDSYYEYLLKAYILLGDVKDFEMFAAVFDKIILYMRRGQMKSCSQFDGEPPVYVNVDSRDGSTINTWMDSLQASFSGLLVLAGFVEEAVCHHALYYAVWKKFGVLPERYNWRSKEPDVNFYPLRPEFAESTYLLYSATKNPFYLRVGLDILASLEKITKVECGYATVHDVIDGSLEDRMESFFLSETMKYLYLLFDLKNPINRHQNSLLFSTEGHIYPLSQQLRSKANEESENTSARCNLFGGPEIKPVMNETCFSAARFRKGLPPLNNFQFRRLQTMAGIGLPKVLKLKKRLSSINSPRRTVYEGLAERLHVKLGSFLMELFF
ncbi:unnamed protein product [Caenorhabditis auriculariae]|uniref:alpha-1,2-Mannosidase n=1 Tax=Caenorhabditis auriculariae TaxID=2777116 RepID=A0A8S1HWC6_9PELO|nr:unnamed protein product [Caenorhabditis auriculariae]